MAEPKMDSRAALDLIEKKLKPQFEKAVAFINSRNAREKTMIIALMAAALIAADYAVLGRPIAEAFRKTLPELAAVESQLAGLRADKVNAERIRRSWEETRDDLKLAEAAFVADDELPALLQELSDLARDSKVKIISLTPVETRGEERQSPRYKRTPLRLSAMAGTHELGSFLAKLEGGPRFFRIINLSIDANPADPRRHRIEVDMETYRHISIDGARSPR